MRQAHRFAGFELAARDDLAARDAGHVGDDGLDLGDVMLAEEFVDVMHGCSRFVAGVREGRGALAHASSSGGTGAASFASRAACLAERAKNARRQRVACVPPFRVPLHAERKSMRTLDAYGFDEPVGRHRFHQTPLP